MSKSTRWCFKATLKVQSQQMTNENISATFVLGHYMAKINQQLG